MERALFILPPQKKHASERGDLLTFFHNQVVDKNGKPYRIAFISMKLSHLQVNDLYFMKSIFVDTERRRGIEGARKEWWYSLKSNK